MYKIGDKCQIIEISCSHLGWKICTYNIKLLSLMQQAQKLRGQSSFQSLDRLASSSRRVSPPFYCYQAESDEAVPGLDVK